MVSKALIATLKDTLDPVRVKALLYLAEQAAAQGDFTTSALFVLASEVCRLTSALNRILLEIRR